MRNLLWSLFLGITCVILPVIGWVKCIIHVLACDFDPIGKAEILYGIGCVTPFGCIIGWFNLGV